MSFENERQYRFAVSLINQEPKGNEMSSPTSPTANRSQWSGIAGGALVTDAERMTVPNMMEALTACIDEQQKIIHELESRFDWALRMLEPTPCCKDAESPPKTKTTLAETLEKLVDRLNNNTQTLRSMISRSEL